MNTRTDHPQIIHNLARNRRTDPLTRVAARYPHEHATAADYAKHTEPPTDTERNIRRYDVLGSVAWIALVVSLGGAVLIALFTLAFPGAK